MGSMELVCRIGPRLLGILEKRCGGIAVQQDGIEGDSAWPRGEKTNARHGREVVDGHQRVPGGDFEIYFFMNYSHQSDSGVSRRDGTGEAQVGS